MKALVVEGFVLDIERRDIDVYKYYHKDVAKMFIPCPDDVEIGDTYENGTFVKAEKGEEVVV